MLYNEGVLIHFPYTYSLLAIHTFFGTDGGIVLPQAGVFAPTKFTMAQVSLHGSSLVNILHAVHS